MLKYSGFDSERNSTTGDFFASIAFRFLFSVILSLIIIFVPVHIVKCLTLLFYLIYTTFNILPIAKSFKRIYWDSFVEQDCNTLSNVIYERMIFQILETLTNYIIIYYLAKFINLF